jgi:ATP-dependent RNA helicase RhlE
VNLASVEVLVLDEADRMFDMGFLPDVRRIVKAVPERRQTLLFSATMPDDVRGLVGEVLSDPLTVQVGHSAPIETVSHAIYPVAQHLKTALLTELLRDTGPGSVLIFTRTKHRAKRVAEQLARAGFEATSLQGNLSQNKRQAALDGFRTGDFRIMVATDIAARGIDVLSISHVINYDMPDTTDAYTHRIGRTGRAERTGEAYTLVTADDVNQVRDVERVLGYRLERRNLPDFDYRAPASARDNEFARDPRPQPVARRKFVQPSVQPSYGASTGTQSRGPRAVPVAAANTGTRSGVRKETVPATTFRPEGTPGQPSGRTAPRSPAPARDGSSSLPATRRDRANGQVRSSGGSSRP